MQYKTTTEYIISVETSKDIYHQEIRQLTGKALIKWCFDNSYIGNNFVYCLGKVYTDLGYVVSCSEEEIEEFDYMSNNIDFLNNVL